MEVLSSMESSPNMETGVRNPKFPEKEIGIQGLKKQILKKGTSWQSPIPGDEVEVHFSGRIENGVRLDSSHDKGEPFWFKLGQGEVIDGWDKGVATMKKGERATFTIPPSLAYGEAGLPPLIPSNATLIYSIELLSWKKIRDLTGDGGVLKKIVTDGEGWATPRDGDHVIVKYKARLENGSEIVVSDEVIEFCIGDGNICPAVTIATKTMRKGEKAELAVKFSYGLCQNENVVTHKGCTVPADTSLVIQLELVSWITVVDVTGDKKVLKKVVKAGEGFDRPNEGSVVKVAYAAKLEDGTELESKGTNEEPFEFITMEEQVNDGLERAIMTMKKGEQAIVTVASDYLRGRDVPTTQQSNSAINYEVKMIDFTKEKQFWKMDTCEKLEACERKKLEGNELFKTGNIRRASKKYEQASNYIEFDHSFTDDEKHLARNLRISCHLNDAACRLKLGEYQEASKLCSKVLEQDPVNVKALYRRSQAYLRVSELEKAEEDIKRALMIDPNNREVKLEYKELKEKQRDYTKRQAELCTTMFSKMCY